MMQSEAAPPVLAGSSMAAPVVSASGSGTVSMKTTNKNNTHINMQFQKLNRTSLVRILKHYGVGVNVDASEAELAAQVASVFDSTHVVDTDVVDNFSRRFMHSSTDKAMAKRRLRSNREIDSTQALIGEQVAAKLSRNNENGSWILGNVIEYDQPYDVYAIVDEDDVGREVNLVSQHVRRLEDSCSHLRKGDWVLAVFPETTSFYRACVAKDPTPNADGVYADVIVRFDDDDDETGRAPPRRVPARFVLRQEVVEPDFTEP